MSAWIKQKDTRVDVDKSLDAFFKTKGQKARRDWMFDKTMKPKKPRC